MPYTCRFCGEKFCAEHRLPENHDCKGLEEYKKKLNEEGQVFRKEKKAGTNKKPSKMGFFSYLKGNISLILLAGIVVTFLVQTVISSFNPTLSAKIFYLGPDFINRPWAILTSIFAHNGSFHLMVNSIVLFFFGPELERRIGSKKLLVLFFLAGALGGLAQALILQNFVLGASAAILGLLGTLTILAPNMRIFLLFLPMRLWMATLFVVLLNVVSLGRGPEASLAHLVGLGIGLLYGQMYKGETKETPQSRFLRR
ncbi:MAG: Membrane associated serine protease GlpG [Candidatus Methanohalarchaeum thermophilum]|uniref:Membrane associated serine protease GlpG n=1 Tax=Methanohalarchaeum thermophilum TaxID=1903181 RepID=A0A1Q6DU11_METT1|nr:MAG: Membrane associated serine protease GlpG [Candidatus Methanohalarchaeum thermophilum]